MTTRRMILAGAAIAGLALATVAGAVPTGLTIGAPAPDFTATDANGKPVALKDLRGRTVVLEWTNDECPFVRKHYEGKNMQALQSKWTGRDVVWLSVISSPPGEQGYADGAKANRLTAERGAKPSAVLLDPAGDLGRLYKAQTTPHMYVIKADGTLAYRGGIDDRPSTKIADLTGAKNFVDAALTEIAEGKPVSVTTARPYGCSVKFES
ncbi:MAG: thioredoxin family protein [Methylobacteriaceae bacterium]|nr:thioredoxin family protein [Methylobacteriaceae bacterium]